MSVITKRIFRSHVYKDDCNSLNEICESDCLCGNFDPECDSIPNCILCGDSIV